MKINKEDIMKAVNDNKVICWSDILVNLGLCVKFQEYLRLKGKQYSILQIQMGKTLIDEIDNILKERIIKSKDKRIRHLKEKYRLSSFNFDALQSCPKTAKEDIDYMELEDL